MPGSQVDFALDDQGRVVLQRAGAPRKKKVDRFEAARGKAVNVIDFHQTPLPDEVAGRDYDHAGIITDGWLLAHTPVADADYYICGPRPFLRAAVSALSFLTNFSRAGVL